MVVGATESTVHVGVGLNNCKNWLGHMSWKEAVGGGGASYGGRTSLEYEKMHPEEADSIHVVFSGYC